MPSSLSRTLPIVGMAVYAVAASVGAFKGGVWAALGLGGGAALFFGAWLDGRKMPGLDRNIVGLALLLLATIALLNLQSGFPRESWHYLMQEATIVLPLCLFFSSEAQKRMGDPRLLPVLVMAAMAGAMALGIELALGGPLLHAVEGMNAPLARYNRGISYLVILAMPMLGYLWTNGRRHEALMLALVLLFPSSLTESRATKAAFLLGLATVALAHYLPRLTAWGLRAFIVALFAFPFAATWSFTHLQPQIERLPDSWRARVEIWDYMSYRIFEHPWLGWGFYSSHFLPYMEPHGTLYQFTTGPAGHPHDVILQLWVELGLPGLALGTLFAFYLLRKAAQMPSDLRPFALGAWMAALCISLVSYSFWDDSLFAAFALTACLFAILKRRSAAHAMSPKRGAALNE